MTAGVFPPTVIPDLDEDDFAKRMVALIPRVWTSDAARKPGGVMYTLFRALGIEKTILLGQLLYALQASRVSTAIEAGLDSVALDYFGPDIARTPGQPDSSFRNTIYANLLASAVTRPAMNLLLTQLIGIPPRLMEPRSTHDTCTWDNLSYYDIDTVANSFRWGDPGLRFQAFAEARRPTFAGHGNYPMWSYDGGWSWDTATSAWLEPSEEWFLTVKRIDQLMTKSKAFGITVWRKYVKREQNDLQTGNEKFVPEGTSEATVSVFPAMLGTYSVVATPFWNTHVRYEIIDHQSFKLIFSTPAPPGGAYCDWVVSPINITTSGERSVPAGATEITMDIPYGANTYNAFATPQFNSSIWIKNVEDLAVTFGFNDPLDVPSSFGYLYVPPYRSGVVEVDEDDDSVTFTIPFTPLDPHQFLIMPSWNTSFSIDESDPENPIVTFGVTAPSDAFIQWAIHES